MATIKGFIRSYGAAVRRAEREQQRIAREAAKRYKKQLKLEEIENASEAVRSYNEYVDILQSLHKNCTSKVDWDEILNTPEPEEPINDYANYNKANYALESYKPSKLKSIFVNTDRKIEDLRTKLEEAKNLDLDIYEKKLREYQEERLNWLEIKGIARGVTGFKTDFYLEAVRYFNPFSDIGELGTRVSIDIIDNLVDIKLFVNGVDIIPNYSLNQTSTGKLSKKKLPKSKFNELYQDHVCSALIRVAREIFAYLPIEKSRISILTPLLNKSTGHLEEEVIISAIIISDTLMALNLDQIDPSDSMVNFIHNMKFSKTTGFKATTIVEFNND